MIILVLVLSLWAMPAWAAEFAVAQSAAPTSNGGTQDFTSSGFGTPLCALFFGGYGTANGTVVNHAAFWIGAYDGTRQYSIGGASEDAQATTDTGNFTDTNSALGTLLNTDQTKDGDGTASFITDGARLTWADAPPSAYLVNALLVGGTGVSNCYVGQLTTNATQDATASTTAPGFQPDIILAFMHHGNTSNQRFSVGMGWRNGGTVVQRGGTYSDDDALTATAQRSALITNRLVPGYLATASGAELTSFDANGFTVTTRDGSGARDLTYVAIKLNALSAFLHTSAAPTSTGNHAITGVGFRPQVGLMLSGDWANVDVYESTGAGEPFGFSVFTEAQSATSSLWSDDAAADSNTESMTDTKVCRTRKDAADYQTCTLVSFDNDGATYNYTATNGTARQLAVLYVQAPAAATGAMKRRLQW